MSLRNGNILTPQALAQQPTVVQQIVQPLNDVQVIALMASQMTAISHELTAAERVSMAQDIMVEAFATHGRVNEGLRRVQRELGEAT